jgi:SPRY domain
LKDGITSGCKYWSFKILEKGVNRNIMIGMSDSSLNLAQDVYPGQVNGCALYLYSGHIYHSRTSVASSNVDLVKTATVIGVLLNMCQNTVTFYANGKPVGTIGADTKVLKAGCEYFPVISLYELEQCVEVMDLVPPKAT